MIKGCSKNSSFFLDFFGTFTKFAVEKHTNKQNTKLLP